MARRFQRLTGGQLISSLGRSDTSPAGSTLIGADWAGFSTGSAPILVELAPDASREPGPTVLNDLNLNAGTESSNVIRVTGETVTALRGTVVKGIRSIKVRALSHGVGSPTMGVVVGALIKNLGVELWLNTDSNGAFAVDVADAAVEDVTLDATVDDGVASFLKLTFA